jgi:hypothetical protein
MNQEQEPENHVENLLVDEFLGKEFYYVHCWWSLSSPEPINYVKERGAGDSGGGKVEEEG